MKRIVIGLIASVLVTASAYAESIPSGCYVADYYRTDDCWGEEVYQTYFDWPNYNAAFEPVETYGSVVATLIEQETLYRLNYIKVAEQAAKDKKLIKKLKAKCGSACRSIR